MEFMKDKLLTKIYENRDEMGKGAAKDIAECIKSLLKEKEEINIIFAAAPSQNDMLLHLCEEDGIEWERINGYHMDEYIGLDSNAPQCFSNFLKRYIFDLKPFKSVNLINAGATDGEAEAERYAKLLKEKHPEIKVGGYGAIGFYHWDKKEEERREEVNYRFSFFRNFIKYIDEHDAPIDFFSWHSYSDTRATVGYDNWLHEELTSLGHPELETHLNEWDPYAEELGTGHHAAEIAAMMIAMQYGNPSVCSIYDMRTANAPYCPLFNPITHKPIHAYYSMVAFNMLYKLGTQIEISCDVPDVYALCATDGNKKALLISNLSGKELELDIIGADLSNARYSVIDDMRLLSWSPATKTLEKNSVMLIEF